MRIRIEMEVDIETLVRIKAIGMRPYRKVTREEEVWWRKREELMGSRLMVILARGEWEGVKT